MTERAAVRLFALFLYALPRGTRAEYAAAMRDDFARRFAAAARERGDAAAWMFAARQCLDAVASGIAERLDIAGRDVAYAGRNALRTPLSAAVVVLTIGIAVGANAAVDGVISAIAFSPVPVADPGSLAVLWEVDPRIGITRGSFTYADAMAVREEARTLQNVAVTADFSGALVGSGPPRMAYGEAATAGLFDVLRVRPQAGRLLTPADERTGARVVVLSDALWRSAFGADPHVVGRTVRLGDVSRTIVGIAQPRVFEFDAGRRRAAGNQFWVPLRAAAWRGAGHSLHVIARIRAGTSIDAVGADLRRIFTGIVRRDPARGDGFTARAALLTDEVFRDVWVILWTFVIVVFGVLLVACANVANLFLSRGSVRTAEIGVRFALGATRARVVTQFVTEAALYAACGGALGLVAAAAVQRTLLEIVPASFGYVRDASIDWTAFAVTFACTIVAAAITGVWPALALARPRLAGPLSHGGRGSAPRAGALRTALVAAEIAVAVAIVATAGLSVRSLQGLLAEPPGMQTAGLYAVDINRASYVRYDTADKANAFFADVRRRFLATPGMTAAAWTNDVPAISTPYTRFRIVGRTYARGAEPAAEFGSVSPEVFGVEHVPLVAGRLLDARDGRHGAPVAVVNAAFAGASFGGPESALGRRIVAGFTTFGAAAVPRTIVGVVGNVRPWPGRPFGPVLYLPLAQMPTFDAYLIAAGSAPPSAVVAAARAAVTGADPQIPPPEVTSLEGARRAATADQAHAVGMLGVLALIALLLALAGVFAVMSYDAARRTHEVGIRAALGARTPVILATILRGAARVALAGIAAGVILSAAAVAGLRDQLIDLQFVDPATLAGVLGVLVATVAAAALIPAWRAARIAPAAALRYE